MSETAAANPLAEDLAHVLQHTSDIWDSLRGEHLFLTGGTGFFGRWLLETFAHANATLDLGASLVVLSRDPDQFKATAPHLAANGTITFVRGDVRTLTSDAVRDQLGTAAPERFQYVIHGATAASAALNAENPLLMVDTIVGGTRATLDFAAANGTQRFLLTSSGAVYGAQPPEITHVPEEYVGGPDCTNTGAAYAEGKRLAEMLCMCARQQYGIEPLLTRCFAFVGPFLPLDTHFAIGNFIRDALRGGPIKVGGDGTPYRSYLYAADLAIWLWTILVRGEPGRPYNVGSPDDLTIRELAEAVRDAIDSSIEVSVAREPAPGAPPSRYVPLTQRAEEELKVRAIIPLRDAIQRTARHARERA